MSALRIDPPQHQKPITGLTNRRRYWLKYFFCNGIFSGGKAVFQELAGVAQVKVQALGMVNLLAKKNDRLEMESSPEYEDNCNGLTRRELEILNLIAQGKSNKLIAAQLNSRLAAEAARSN